jgi:hypothetical protein
MFNLAKYPLQRSFGRGPCSQQPSTKARFACARRPGSFCFSWQRRHAVSRILLETKTFNSPNWRLQYEYSTTERPDRRETNRTE